MVGDDGDVLPCRLPVGRASRRQAAEATERVIYTTWHGLTLSAFRRWATIAPPIRPEGDSGNVQEIGG